MPNYPASHNALTYATRPYNLSQLADPLDFEGPGVVSYESKMEDLDYEQPRALWEKVFDAGAKERFVEVSRARLNHSPPSPFPLSGKTDAPLNLYLAAHRTSPVTCRASPAPKSSRGSSRSSRRCRPILGRGSRRRSRRSGELHSSELKEKERDLVRLFGLL